MFDSNKYIELSFPPPQNIQEVQNFVKTYDPEFYPQIQSCDQYLALYLYWVTLPLSSMNSIKLARILVHQYSNTYLPSLIHSKHPLHLAKIISPVASIDPTYLTFFIAHLDKETLAYAHVDTECFHNSILDPDFIELVALKV